MKVKIEVIIKPFIVPNFVIQEVMPGDRQDGFTATEGIPLSMIDADTLWRMCSDFTDAVFKKAGKEQPPRAV